MSKGRCCWGHSAIRPGPMHWLFLEGGRRAGADRMAKRLRLRGESMRRLILSFSHTQKGILSGCEEGQVLLGSFSHPGPMHWLFKRGCRRVGADRMAKRLRLRGESMRRLILASSHTQKGILSGCEQGLVFLGSFNHPGPMHWLLLEGGKWVGLTE